ncbi:hypothetical protein PINS_up006016 [Pythium insidiosum]|nr:hypothetical protein PINS_up006016 [Pythium insidiosum]
MKTANVVALPVLSASDASVSVSVAAALAAATPSASTSSSSSSSTLSADERRRRRNEKERLRVRGLQSRLESLRRDLRAHEQHYDQLQRELERRTALATSAPHQLHSDASGRALVRRYLELVKEAEHLQDVKHALGAQLHARVLKSTALRTVVSLETVDFISAMRETSTTSAFLSTALSAIDRSDVSSKGSFMSASSLFEHVLLERPFSADEAHRLVRETCVEMMEMLCLGDWEDSGEAFGWRGGHFVDGDVLRFKLSQSFAAVGAQDLMLRTWALLTDLDAYQHIQPEATELRVLQRVNDECWIVAITVTNRLTAPRHALLLVARALIHGGYLVTFRTIPLSRVQKEFIERETGGMIVNIFSWYNFQERTPEDPTDKAPPGCDVIFGGTARNGDARFLQQFKLELLSGITRWQTAVGCSRFVFTPRLAATPR